MKPTGFLAAALSPLVAATAALALLKRAGISSPRLSFFVVAGALACAIGNTVLIVLSQIKK